MITVVVFLVVLYVTVGILIRLDDNYVWVDCVWVLLFIRSEKSWFGL